MYRLLLLHLSTLLITVHVTGQTAPLLNTHGPTGYVGDIALDDQARILITGNFLGYNNQAINGVARLLPDGSLDPSFVNAGGIDGLPLFPSFGSYSGPGGRDILVQNDGKIIIGGEFTSYNGQAEGHIVRLNDDGSPDASFMSGTGFNGTVLSIKALPNGQFLCGGHFTSYDGTSLNAGLARLNGDGTLDLGFQVDQSAGYVSDIAVYSDGSIACVGSSILKLNSNGSVDMDISAMNDLFISSNIGRDRVIIQSNDDLVISSGIINVNAAYPFTNTYTVVGLVGVHANGQVDPSFISGLTAPPLTPNTVALEKGQNDEFYLSGSFAAYTPTGTIPRDGRRNFSRHLADGSLDTSFPHIAMGGTAILTDGNGAVYVGGRDFLRKYAASGAGDSSFNPFNYSASTFNLSNYPDPDQEEAENGNMYADAGTLDLVFDSEGPWNWRGDQIVGLHFKDVVIPVGATIESAHIQFTAAGTGSSPCNLTISGVRVSNAPPIGWQPYAMTTTLNSGSITTNTVQWQPGPWATLEDSGPAQRTPNLAPIVQEVVDLLSWTPHGGDMKFFITGSGQRQAYSTNMDPSKAAKLHIVIRSSATVVDCFGIPNGTAFPGSPCPLMSGQVLLSGGFDPSCNCLPRDCAGVPGGNATLDDCGECNGLNDCLSAEVCTYVSDIQDGSTVLGSPVAEEAENGEIYANAGDLDLVKDSEAPWFWRGDQTAGLNFFDVSIPAGAVITHAWIQFTAASQHTTSDVDSLTIHSEANGNAPPIGWNLHNISSRMKTSNSVHWTLPFAWQPGNRSATTRTADLAPIVQELVDRSDWQDGNNMMFIITGSAERSVMHFSPGSVDNPELCIRYQLPGPAPRSVETNILIEPRPRVSLFPNPNRGDLLHIRLHAWNEEGSGRVDLRIIDLSGRVVLQESRTMGADQNQLKPIDISALGAGTFLVELNGSSIRSVERFVVH